MVMMVKKQEALILIILSITITNSQALFCQRITSFDAFCQLQSKNVIIVLSAHVCEATQPFVSLTYIKKDYDILKKVNLESPFFIKDGTFKVSTALSKNDGNLNVTLIASASENDSIKHWFNFQTKAVNCHGDNRPKKPSIEANSQRLGPYSSLLVPSQTSKSIPKVLYFLFVDPCTIPYSYTVLTTNGDQDIKKSTFTDTKNDSLIPMVASIGSKGGLHLIIENLEAPSTFEARLSYLVKQGGSPQVLIGDVYDTQIGRICPATSSCTNKKNAFDKECIVNWIDFDNEIRHVETGLSFKPCMNPMFAKVFLHVKNPDGHMIFKDYIDVTSLRKDDWLVENNKGILQLGWFVKERDFTASDGFLKLDDGILSLYVTDSGRKSHVMVLRHYHGKIIPLLSVYFNGTRDSLCEVYKKTVEGASEDSHVTPIIVGVLSALAVILLLVAGVIYYRHRTRYSRVRRHMEDSAGLPHRIQLADDEFDDEIL